MFSQAIQAFLSYPHNSYKRITQYFDDSYTRQHGLPYYAGHRGTDYDASLNTPIYAAADGQVIKAADGAGDGCQRNTNDGGGFGNHIIIAHPNGYHTIYAHLQKGSVKITQNQAVKAGNLLGLAGSSGRTYGSDACGTFEHLHFEIRSQRYGHHVNPYNLDTGCLFLGGCETPQLPNSEPKTPSPKTPASTYSLDRLGWLDTFKDINPPTQHLAAGSYDGGSRDGLHATTSAPDGHIYYHEVWWDTPERENGHILDRLYKLDPFGPADRKVTAQTTGNFGDGDDDILAVAFAGDDVIHFYHRQRELGTLNPHPGRPTINHLATGDIDNDGRAELLATIPSDDHIYLFDNWNGQTLKRKVGFLDAHDDNPTISAIATMDIDSNGYDELLVATTGDDHIYEYYFDQAKAQKWWKFWQLLPRPFIKQGYLDCHGDTNSPQINPRITGLVVGKFQGQSDHLAVTTAVDDHIYFYWERDLANAWNGKILRQKKFKNAFAETERPVVHTMAAGDFDDSGDDELVVATADNDHLTFFGHDDGGGYIGHGGDENFYDAELVAQNTKRVMLRPGQLADIWAEFKNTGNASWSKDSSPEFQLRLDPTGRNSIFYDNSWPRENSPAKLADQEVSAGEITRLHFKIQAPVYSGQYSEYFQLYSGNQAFARTVFGLNVTVDGELPSWVTNLRASTSRSDWWRNYTNDSTPTFHWDKARDRWSGVAGYYLAIDDPTPDGVHRQDWWVDNVTTWTTPVALTNGWHTVAVTSKDKAGNVNPANTNRLGDAPYLKFMVDTAAPTPPHEIRPDLTRSIWQKIKYRGDPEKNITASRQPVFIWPAGSDEHSGIRGYKVEVFNQRSEKIQDLTLKIYSPDKRSAFTWQYPSILSDGEYRLKVKTIDKAGNLSAAVSFPFAVDITPPVGSLSINKSVKYTNNPEATLDILTKDTSLVTAYSLSNDGSNWREFSLKSGNQPVVTFSIPWQLAAGDGTRMVYVKFRDSFRHWSEPIADSIILDTEKPSSWINDLPVWHNTLTFFVSWFGQDNLAGVEYYDIQYKDSLTNKWITWLSKTKLLGKFFTGLDGATYWFRSRAHDQAGNQENYPVEPDTETTVDVTKPDPPLIASPTNNSTFNASADEAHETPGVQKTFRGTAEAGSQITLVATNSAAKTKYHYSVQTDAQNNWIITGVTLEEGKNIIKVTTTDSAGNWNDSGEQLIWLDTIAPVAIADLKTTNTTYHSTVLTWTTPGDDDRQGTAKAYDIRYSRQPLTTDDFAQADAAVNIPVPEKAGTTQNFTIANLDPKETYYFALKASDEIDNWSGISNVAMARTLTSANSIALTTSKNMLTAEGSKKTALTATIFDPKNKTGPKLAGEKVSFKITKDNGLPSQTGKISALKDNGNGTYSATYTAASKVGSGQITVSVNCATCMNQQKASIDIKLIPGHPAGEIKLNAQPTQVNANGSNTTAITSQTITDQTGNPVADGEMITVSTQQGAIITPDADAARSGIQMASKKGVIKFTLRSDKWNGYGEANKQVVVSTQSVLGTATGRVKVIFRDVTTPPAPIITTPGNYSNSATIATSNAPTVSGSTAGPSASALIFPGNNCTNDNTPTISGLAEKKARVLIYKNGKYHHYTYANTAGKFSYTFNKALSDGYYNFRVKARDAAGNTSGYSNGVNVTIDTVPPAITSRDPSGTVHHRQNTVFADYRDNASGTGIDTSRTKLKINGATISAKTSSSQIKYTSTLAEKNYSYKMTATVTDRAGNTTSANWDFAVQLFTYLKSRVESGYRVSIVPNWPNSKGLIQKPSWWNPNFNDSTWRSVIYPAHLPPSSVPKPEAASEWLWGDSRVDPNETTLIRKRFVIPGGVTIDEAAIRMSADNEAWGFVGFVNGHYFGKVPEALSGGNPYLFGLKKFIRPGDNLLAIQVSNGNDKRAGVAYTLTVKYHD
ncbi:MAG: peptidoglycan DD-metalloendopeptidase family protein [Parcubacteria group bacterium]|nr:peptidoglycan DD-metalloendopeptidase family protein [Parcubacteria group bacterium]